MKETEGFTSDVAKRQYIFCPEGAVITREVDQTMSNKHYDPEFVSIAKDILAHKEFRRLDSFFHHTTSILEHVKAVAWLTFRVCRALRLNYVSATRGALLHDFFLYDWHEYKRNGNQPNHGLNHPRVALKNSLKHFTLNELEQDIILKHMWPKLFGYPRHLESWIVSFIDKYVTITEFIAHGWQGLLRRLTGKR